MIKLQVGKVGELGGGPKQKAHIIIEVAELETTLYILIFQTCSHHIEHEESVRLLVQGAVEAVPVGAPQKRPAVAGEFLEQTALPTQAADYNVGNPMYKVGLIK